MVSLSQVLGDQLELVDLRPVAFGQRLCDRIEAMVDVIVDERLLGLNDGFLYSEKLLGDVETGSILFEHLDHGAQMPVGAAQALDDFGMTGVGVCVARHDPIPLEGIPLGPTNSHCKGRLQAMRLSPTPDAQFAAVALMRFRCCCKDLETSGEGKNVNRRAGVSGKSAQLGTRPVWARVFWSVAVICALLIAPLFTITTHGPGAYAEAVAAAAEDLAHGHSHDFSGDGSASHDATDHEHQSFAVIPRAEHPIPDEEADDLYIEASFASGLDRGGPRRPPRLDV